MPDTRAVFSRTAETSHRVRVSTGPIRGGSRSIGERRCQATHHASPPVLPHLRRIRASRRTFRSWGAYGLDIFAQTDDGYRRLREGSKHDEQVPRGVGDRYVAEAVELAAADTAVDSIGAVTNPMYPELDRKAAVEFHRAALSRTL
ncbi:hypothetical protein Hbl1158_03015 [Halobaculum sp. CBA1158]|uniref:hypothetical protein n=1 Tax=Halobaculum sp. CBA1158 TaxID=2904243 RepID=UPI001F1F3EBC|nr:hypothetical protein [Halobaculum sp. CBA1158]UIP00356.1 hypothetical protein Hbl1158_03015 [Halobaculum sp. CBA1158]